MERGIGLVSMGKELGKGVLGSGLVGVVLVRRRWRLVVVKIRVKCLF